MKLNDENYLTIICDCHSLDHQVRFWWDDEDNELYCEPHLYTHHGFFWKLWRGLKFAFGYRSRYGDWDEILFSTEDTKKLKEFLEEKLR